MVKLGPFSFFNKPLSSKHKLITNVVAVKTIEQLKGEVQSKRSIRKQESELGEPHPFNYEKIDGIYDSVGLINGIINKIVDYTWGPGVFTKSEDARAKEIIDQWMRDVNFEVHGRQWLREALKKGSAFMELGGDETEIPQGVKVLNSNNMFVKRNKKGRVIEYNQLLGGLGFGQKVKKISFKPFQVAQFNIDAKPGVAYGLGLIFPSAQNIQNLLKNEEDMQKLVSRKAGAPYVFTIKNDDSEIQVTSEDVNALAEKVSYLDNSHEWVFGPNVDVKFLDFGNLGANFSTAIKHNFDMIAFGTQTPEVILGRGNIPEGIAKVQMDGFERYIKSIQAEMEKVIESKMFKRVLQSNGLDNHVEFEWGQPSESQTNERIVKLTALLSNAFLSQSLRKEIEKQIAVLLGLDKNVVESIEEEREREEELPQPIVPGQNNPNKEHLCESFDDNKEYSLTEWLGFNYQDYLLSILKVLEIETFNDLRANSAEELAAGRLDELQVENLRKALKKGFKNGESITSISERIREEVQPVDALAMKDGKIVLNADGNPRIGLSSARRPVMIARTEITRIANLGSIEDYKDAGLTEYRWLATLSDRTCIRCAEMNGKVFTIEENSFLPPLHVGCRCTTTALTRLD